MIKIQRNWYNAISYKCSWESAFTDAEQSLKYLNRSSNSSTNSSSMVTVWSSQFFFSLFFVTSKQTSIQMQLEKKKLLQRWLEILYKTPFTLQTLRCTAESADKYDNVWRQCIVDSRLRLEEVTSNNVSGDKRVRGLGGWRGWGVWKKIQMYHAITKTATA